jgi:hypothetical protein
MIDFEKGQLNIRDAKLEALRCLLDKHELFNFTSFFDPRSLTYKYRVKYEGKHHYGEFTDEVLRYEAVEYIAYEIVKLISQELIINDPENMFKNENEQAMLDAAMDYGLI